MPEYYEIKIRGHLDQCWSERFAGLRLTHLEENETLLSGSLSDPRLHCTACWSGCATWVCR